FSAVGNAGAYMYNFFVANEKRSRGFTFEMLKKEDYFKLKDYDEFFSRWQVSIDNPLQKDHEFMKWRLGAPGTEYRIVTARKNTKLVGVAVTRKSVMEGIPVLAILDMMVLQGSEKCLGGINRMFRKVANSHGVEAIVTMMSRKWAKFYGMFQLGFIASPYIFSLIIKKLNPDIDDEMLFDDRRWHLMWVDSDDL
nr:hypothetical protein [Bacteroidota bacterium]